jgi:hypothetical protein
MEQGLNGARAGAALGNGESGVARGQIQNFKIETKPAISKGIDICALSTVLCFIFKLRVR